MIYYVFLMAMHALEMHALEMHALEMLHAFEMLHTLEMHALEIGPSSTLHNLKDRMNLAPSHQLPQLSQFGTLWESQAVP